MKVGDTVTVSTFSGPRTAEIEEIPNGGDVVIRYADNGKRAVVKVARLRVARSAPAPGRVERSDVVPFDANSTTDGRTPAARAPARPRTQPIRSRDYLDFVRARACFSCGADGPSDPHHYGPRGMGQKTDDLRVVPLCRKCHDHFHDTNTLPGLDRPTTTIVILRKQVDLLVEWHRDR